MMGQALPYLGVSPGGGGGMGTVQQPKGQQTRKPHQCYRLSSTHHQPSQIAVERTCLRRGSPGQGREDSSAAGGRNKPPFDNIHCSASLSLGCEPGQQPPLLRAGGSPGLRGSSGGRRCPSSPSAVTSHSPEHPTPASVGAWGVLPNPHFSSSQAANGPLGQDTCASAQPCLRDHQPKRQEGPLGPVFLEPGAVYRLLLNKRGTKQFTDTKRSPTGARLHLHVTGGR